MEIISAWANQLVNIVQRVNGIYNKRLQKAGIFTMFFTCHWGHMLKFNFKIDQPIIDKGEKTIIKIYMTK